MFEANLGVKMNFNTSDCSNKPNAEYSLLIK